MSDKYFTVENNTAHLSHEAKRVIKNRILKKINYPMGLSDITMEDFSLQQDANGINLGTEDQAKKAKAKEIVNLYIKNIKDIIKGNTISIPLASGEEIKSNNLVFCGGESCGKTMLICSILKKALEETYSLYYFPWLEFRNLISCFENQDGFKKAEYIFRKSKLIAIDGIYGCDMRPIIVNNIATLLEIRIHNSLPVLIGSNISPDELLKIMPPPGQKLISQAIVLKLPAAEINTVRVIN